MALPPSPDKERELERRLQEIKEEEESLSSLHKELLSSFTNVSKSNALDWNEFQAQEVGYPSFAHERTGQHSIC
jgi:hypothetical protein